MDHILSGLPVAAAILEKASKSIEEIKAKGNTPKLAILRVGENPEDLRYERNLIRKGESIGIQVESRVLPLSSSEDDIRAAVWELDEDHSVHGILMFRPLPAGVDEDAICREINPEKDVDGAAEGSLAGVFTGREQGFAPCTARAVMEILKYYGAALEGKKVTVLGRSLVVGKPLAMMLLAENATVTVCHSKTVEIREETRRADILVTAIGKANMVDKSYVRKEQIVLDVGVSLDPATGRFSGDVNYDEVEPEVASITPVKGGVGAVTTAVLLTQVVEAALRQTRKPSWTD